MWGTVTAGGERFTQFDRGFYCLGAVKLRSSHSLEIKPNQSAVSFEACGYKRTTTTTTILRSIGCVVENWRCLEASLTGIGQPSAIKYSACGLPTALAPLISRSFMIDALEHIPHHIVVGAHGSSSSKHLPECLLAVVNDPFLHKVS